MSPIVERASPRIASARIGFSLRRPFRIGNRSGLPRCRRTCRAIVRDAVLEIDPQQVFIIARSPPIPKNNREGHRAFADFSIFAGEQVRATTSLQLVGVGSPNPTKAFNNPIKHVD